MMAVAATLQYKPDYNSRLIDKIHKRIETKDKFFSLEFYPPRTANGACNLFEKCNRMSKGKPLFCDVTSNMNNLHLHVASKTQTITNCDAMIQLDSSSLDETTAIDVLNNAKMLGLSTVMVMAEESKSSSFFPCTAALVQLIRERFGNYFTICVAGYTSVMDDPQCLYEHGLSHLKDQLNAGADFIITNMVFDAEEFLAFVKRCRESGINTPIIPGILPIQSYGCIRQLIRMSKVKIPDRIMNVLRPIQKNDEAVLKYGIFLTVEICKLLLKSLLCCGIHFFTLNREVATTEVLKRIGLWQENKNIQRALPWHANDVRDGEEVRPIFWACRPESYEYRTAKWEEFPNGRWGDSSLASFGHFRDYKLLYLKVDKMIPVLQIMWGENLACSEDVYNVFVAFLSGTANAAGFKVSHFPWTEDDLSPETSLLLNELIAINSRGVLTINSQPHVNAMPSTNKIFGWGSPGGYVFQKAYLEFFCSEEDSDNLLKVLPGYPFVNYHIVDQKGTKNFSNTAPNSSNAVTWGVFTGKPVIQPTIVDGDAFQVWKEEAFELWLQQWGRLYHPNSTSYGIIKHFHDTFCLVNLVDNDYIKGNCLFEIVNRVIGMRNS